MGEKAPFVDYLSDNVCQFRMDFVFFDPALTTSEIKPLHLSLPGNKNLTRKPAPVKQQETKIQSSRATSGLRSSRAEPAQTADKQQDQEVIKSKRLLSPVLEKKRPSLRASVASRAGGVVEGVKPNTLSSTIPRKTESSSPTGSPHQEVPKKEEAQQKASRTSSSLAKTAPVQQGGSVNFNFAMDCYYVLPLTPAQVAQMSFVIENTPSMTTFKLYPPDTMEQRCLLSAQLTGKTRTSQIELLYDGQAVGIYKYNPTNKTYFVGLTGLNPVVEACAVLFNTSYTTANQPRIFDFVIPALKKVDNRNQMYKVPFSESSVLIQVVQRMAKEAIRLKARIPISSGNTYDMTFEGKFSMNSLTNFILYHESSPKRDICSFHQIADNKYMLTCGYPLSPLQGFLAAVSACIPVA